MRIHKIRPEIFPEAWASAWGEDEYGLWMAFTYKGVKQVFRWIEPGEFLMGSPEDEPERFDNETQHAVTLTHGYWLAETACTQALWQAMMGDNPSEFKGDQQPVANISWDDAQRFIDKANGLKPELELCLPTEAQWEYACRAGTTTPFSFGDQISSEQVNFNGEYPYNEGRESQWRKETVEVKSLPANDWGLYEMHGNVWEWCQDWYAPYPADRQSDPDEGSQSGVHRVLRGGSWIGFGRHVRSACRRHRTPDRRYNFTGFRLARGH